MPDNRPISYGPRRIIAPQGPQHYSVVSSTNDLALAARADGAAVWADRQTAGRGRHGARWECAAEKGLCFSVCLEGSPQGLPFAAALAVRDALAPLATVKVKWPNDLLLDGKKVSGILIDHREGWNALGIGVNVNQTLDDFSEALRSTATSLAIETGIERNLDSLLKDMLDQLDLRILQLRCGGLIELRNEWAAACDMTGKWIEREGVRGRVCDLDHDGALLVQTEVCIARIDSGVITIHEEAPCSW